MLLSSTGAAPRILMRGALPARPKLLVAKLRLAPGVWEKPANATSAEFTPVPPPPTLRVEKPAARVREPMVSEEAVCGRPL